MKKIISYLLLVFVIGIVGCGNKIVDKRSNGSLKEVKNVESDKIENEENSNEKEQNDKEKNPVFYTEYDIEAYCKGVYIVSKNNGLLYGVLNQKGEEVLPVKYDNISFLNDDEVTDEECDNLYIETTYEDIHTVFNETGKKIIDAIDSNNKPIKIEEKIKFVGYEIVAGRENTYFFETHDKQSHKTIFYKEDGTKFLEINDVSTGEKDVTNVTLISKNNYLVTVNHYLVEEDKVIDIESSAILYDINNNVLGNWDGMIISEIIDEKYVFAVLNPNVSYVSVDKNGGFVEGGVELFSNSEEYEINDGALKKKAVTASDNKEFYLGKDKNIKLYESNDTWKLEDLEGNPLYEERYYLCMREKGCTVLANEDNQMCLFDRNGQLLVDYGWLTTDGDRGYFMNNLVTDENFFAGNDGVCFIMKERERNAVYYFGK